MRHDDALPGISQCISEPDTGDDLEFDEAAAFLRLHEDSSEDEPSALVGGVDYRTGLLHYSTERPPATACSRCRGSGYVRLPGTSISRVCKRCRGVAFDGIDPKVPTTCFPGSEGKVAVLARRYQAGTKTYLPGDAGDHEPEYAGA